MKREIKITFTEGTGKDAITTEKVFKNLNNKDKRIIDYSTKLMAEDAQNYLTEGIASLFIEDAEEPKTKLTIQMILDKAKELDIDFTNNYDSELGNVLWLAHNSDRIVRLSYIQHNTWEELIAIVEGVQIIREEGFNLPEKVSQLEDWIKENV